MSVSLFTLIVFKIRIGARISGFRPESVLKVGQKQDQTVNPIVSVVFGRWLMKSLMVLEMQEQKGQMDIIRERTKRLTTNNRRIRIKTMKSTSIIALVDREIKEYWNSILHFIYFKTIATFNFRIELYTKIIKVILLIS